MTCLIAYIIGFIAMFVVLSVEEFRLSKKVFLYDVSFFRVLGWSIIWPLSLLFVIIGAIFG